MPTERTLAQHRKRWQTAEHRLEQERTDREGIERWGREQAEAARLAAERVDQLTAELRDMDPEARLLADLEAAVTAHGRRVQLAAEAAEREQRRAGDDYGYAMASSAYVQREPTRPALDSPLGRALLHLAARHGLAIEATVVYPDPQPEQQIVSVPRHVAEQLQQMPYEAFRQ